MSTKNKRIAKKLSDAFPAAVAVLAKIVGDRDLVELARKIRYPKPKLVRGLRGHT